jgi:hypothetical protein
MSTMRTGVAAAVASVVGYVNRPYSPTYLFQNGEQGFWYDPSDFSTLFQDAAGTTPVTAVEQPCSLMLDKRLGLTLGPELVTNGDFSNGTTGWTAESGTTATVSGGAVSLSNASGAFAFRTTSTIAITSGKWYEITFDLLSVSGVFNFRLRSSGGKSGETNTAGAKKFLVLADASTQQIWFYSNAAGQTATIDNISVRELPGNHAFTPAAASTARPTVSARVNLLTKTEQFDDAAWAKQSGGIGVTPSVTANAGTAPNGTLTADRVQFNCTDPSSATNRSILTQTSITVINGVGYGRQIYIKAFDASNVGKTLRFVVEGLASSEVIITLTADWQNISGVFTSTSTSVNFLIETRGTFTTQTADALLWGADLRVANDGVGLPPYQRVNTATDYDTVGFPVYLRADGSNDFLQTNSIDFSGTDKVTVAAGVRQTATTTTTGQIYELSTDVGVNNGAIGLASPGAGDSNVVRMQQRGTTFVGFNVTINSPWTRVLTQTVNIAGDQSILRENGTQAGSSTSDLGTGNFGNYPLYLFSRAGTSLFFNGRFYGSVGRGAQSNDQQIAALEGYMNNLTKAY